MTTNDVEILHGGGTIEAVEILSPGDPSIRLEQVTGGDWTARNDAIRIAIIFERDDDSSKIIAAMVDRIAVEAMVERLSLWLTTGRLHKEA